MDSARIHRARSRIAKGSLFPENILFIVIHDGRAHLS
jgi:hypothetical protein